MSLQILINWMEEEIKDYKEIIEPSLFTCGMLEAFDDCIEKAKELNKNKTYTKKEMDRVKSEAWWEGWYAYGESL